MEDNKISLNEFDTTYKRRKKFFENEYKNEILKKAYIKLRKGSEIRVQEIDILKNMGKRSISEILIDVPQVKMVKDQITDALSDVEEAQETDIRIIFGDYGHGKSQTAHLLLDTLMDNNRSRRIVHLETITTVRKFFQNLSYTFQNHFENYHQYVGGKVEPLLDILSKSEQEEKHSISKLNAIFMDLITEISSRGLSLTLIFDELDKSFHDPFERILWIDFLVSATDSAQGSLLLVCFLPQEAANDIIKIDQRMMRWSLFFGIQAIHLNGKYSNQLTKGIANIMALSSKYSRYGYNQDDLNYFYDSIVEKHSYLSNLSIRGVNIWSVSLSELIIRCTKFKMWKQWHKFLDFDRTVQGQKIERRLRNLLLEDTLPQFQMNKQDGEAEEILRVEYFAENLTIGDFRSDGHFKQYIRYMNNESLKHTIACEVKYTTNANHMNNQVNKVLSLADQYPVIFFSLGPENKNANEMDIEIQNLLRNDQTKYPIYVINISHQLLVPLIIMPEERKTQDLTEINQLLFGWSKIVTSHRDKLEHFVKELPGLMIQRQMALQAFEILGKPAKKQKRIKRSPTLTDFDFGVSKTEVPEKNVSKVALDLFLARVIVELNSIKQFKKKSTIENNSRKYFTKQYPELVSTMVSKLPEIFDLLESENLIALVEAKNGIRVTKTVNWDKNSTLKLLQNTIKI